MSALGDLSIQDFAAFYEAVHGYAPFPWQTRLAGKVAGGGPWPTWLALPTASGKTSVIDVAVFVLACQAAEPPSARSAPRRIFFVVDRRVVVDQAADHARALANQLGRAESGVLRTVADRLRSLGGESNPLAVHQLRGGMYRDDAWVRSPLQPAVIASTVDQVGSRLLFRGYGLRGGSVWPVHAGLTANDALVVLDEAHCSNPFLQTLSAVAEYRRLAEQPLELPFQFAVMSATPPVEATSTFGLDEDDLRHEILQARLNAPKPSRLVLGPRTTSARGESAFVETIATEAVALLSGDRSAIGIIVNRVRTAKLVAEAIRTRDVGTVALLTGRTRPIDADAIREQLSSLETGRRVPGAGAMFVVATQTLEVGADLDFDGLVTECASLDALRQRFGRLNRGGRGVDGRGVIVIRGEYADAKDEDHADPIYGLSLTHTWNWLNAMAVSAGNVDFGISAIQRRRAESAVEGLEMQLTDAAVMLPGHIDRWAQTSPVPTPDPDVALFLHGPAREDVDVQVCWRADLDTTLNEDEQAAVDVVALCPPTSRECMPVPLRVFRRWLAGAEPSNSSPDDIADIDVRTDGTDEALDDGQTERTDDRTRWCVRWRGVEAGRDSSMVVTAESAVALRPGETVVVPAGLGGWNTFGHVVKAPDAGGDYGEETNATQRRRPILRLTRALVATWDESEARTLALRWMETAGSGEEEPDPRADEALQELLRVLANDESQPLWRRVVASTIQAHPRAQKVFRYPTAADAAADSEPRWVLTTYRRIPARAIRAIQQDGPLAFSDEDDNSVATVDVPLLSHLDGVARWASRFARAAGLPDHLVVGVEMAAHLHDVGKADRRFQAMLRGGSRWLAASAELLAKSAGAPRSVAERRRLREECGYPEGGRHELLSVRLAEQAETLLAGRDRDLILHLIASHHGRCRPFAPVIVDVADVDSAMAPARVARIVLDSGPLETSVVTGLERLDSGIASRFWLLNRRYGWWGVAFLEAILRVADWCRSEEEQVVDERQDGEEAA